jgi:MmyB-like transcription regulator ligand binding domain
VRSSSMTSNTRTSSTSCARRSNAPRRGDPRWSRCDRACSGCSTPITLSAAFVRNRHLDILSANRLGYALYSEAFVEPSRPVNLARFVFLDDRSRDFYANWESIADAAAANLRAEAGRDPYDRDLTDLVGELSMRSEEFRVRWGTHDVGEYRSGTQHFRHPLVGELNLAYETFAPLSDVGLLLVVYAAELDSPSQDALARLAGWSTPPDETSPARTRDRS